ncbi:hypothetical protein B0J13DRAFT_534723 [Dactylonectria estremocensis]|uniref:Uncharacterized protein n=1 Tax=Dactylonectria estremocensis TaxID=1079267 RepID=A0A9P9CZA2_9HYPO|nr:hypothetical protein B0J13DRAFT_534723 [Dactylonectria estremocensis]
MSQATTSPWKAEAPLTPDTDDAEMVGFLDAPLNREPALVDQTSVAFTNDDPETDSPRPADRGETLTKVPLHGFRAFLDSLIAIIVIVQPWTISMVLCWLPITRVPLQEAPRQVLVNIIASTVEVPTVFIFLIIRGYIRLTRRNNPSSTGPEKRLIERVSHFLALFLILDPIVTGIYMRSKLSKMHCDDGDNSLQCRVGKRFMVAIAVFRGLGVGALFWGGMMLLVIFGNNFVGGGSLETNAA